MAFQSEINVEDRDGELFKPFAATYKYCAFAMSCNMMFPDREHCRRKVIIMSIQIATFGPCLWMFLLDFQYSFAAKDFDNITRQLSISIPFAAVVVKMILAYRKQDLFLELINEISDDLTTANNLDDDVKIMVKKNVEDGLNAERIWVIQPFLVVMPFILVPVIIMFGQAVTSKEIDHIPIHDITVPFFNNSKYESPVYETVFIYMLYLSIYFIFNFMGFDGAFLIIMNHAVHKFKILTHRLSLEFKKHKDVKIVRKKLNDAILEHNKAYEFVEKVGLAYAEWLAIVFIATTFQLCINLYQVTIGDQVDLRYSFFLIGTIGHVFFPSYFSTKVKSTAEHCSFEFYNCKWENFGDRYINQALAFMMARSQRPIKITAVGMVNFNLDMFSSMMHTSYSAYTLMSK